MTKQELESLLVQVTEQNQMLIERLNNIEKIQKEIIEKESKTFDKISTNLKEKPLVLEDYVIKGLKQVIEQSAKNYLESSTYNSFKKLVDSVIDKHSNSLSEVFNEVMLDVISKETFKESVKEVFAKKVARELLNIEISPLSKVSNSLKNDAEFKAKLLISINNIVSEFLNK